MEAQSSESDREFTIQHLTTEEKAKRAARNLERLTRRVLFFHLVMVQKKVLTHWEQIAAESQTVRNQIAAESTTARKTRPRMPPRHDLCFVGSPVPPTSKQYPVSRSVCNHEGMLMATGGRSSQGKFWTWTCSGCGSRWNRVTEEAATWTDWAALNA